MFNLPICDFIALFNKAQEKELEQKAWELWVSLYPHMTEDNFISYEEILNMAKQQEAINETVQHGCYVDQLLF